MAEPADGEGGDPEDREGGAEGLGSLPDDASHPAIASPTINKTAADLKRQGPGKVVGCV